MQYYCSYQCQTDKQMDSLRLLFLPFYCSIAVRLPPAMACGAPNIVNQYTSITVYYTVWYVLMDKPFKRCASHLINEILL